MPARDRQPAGDTSIERDYAEHRSAVLGMLSAEFPRLADPDEIYQEAWAELLALEARGETVHHRRGLLRTIAWRRAADATRRRRPQTVDPATLVSVADDRPPTDEQAQRRLDGQALRAIVDSLDDQQAAAIKLRFDQQLSAREVGARLGVSEKRLEAIVTAAYQTIAAQLAIDDGEARWTRRQRSLLLACELGIASARQRRRAQSMVDRDPACRAMLRAMRISVNDVAAVLPMPVLVEEHERVGALARAAGRLDELWAAARHLADRLAGRGMPDGRLLEQAGAGGATVGGGAVAAKAMVVCLALSGAGAICADVAKHRRDQPAKAEARLHHVTRAKLERPRDHGQAVVHLAQTPAITTTASRRSTTTTTTTTTEHHQPPVSSPKFTPPPSPAPAGSSEFGPGEIGSAPASQQPAAAPQDGGGEFAP